MTRKRVLGIARWLLIGVGIFFLVQYFWPDSPEIEVLKISQVIQLAQDNQVSKIEVNGDYLEVVTTEGQHFSSRKETGVSILQLLEQSGVAAGSIEIEVQEPKFSFLTIFLSLLPVLVFAALIIYMVRKSRGAMSQMMNIGKSQARNVAENKPDVTFDDMAGAEEAKQEMEEIVEFLRYPEKFAKLGAKIPRGVLLSGPPGTGKTLISRAIAGEAEVPFFSISGSEFVEMFVGVGASRVRDLFTRARAAAPAIIFIDEIDAVGRRRGAGMGGGNDEREQTLNQILVQMDGFDDRTNVIVIAATNRPDILDTALLRPGRFDRRIMLDLPDTKGREAILQVHLKGKPLAPEVDVLNLARQTHGFSGADLANLVNEAAILAAREGSLDVQFSHLTESIDRVIGGPARRSREVSERERKIVAYHEAGHALVAAQLPDADPVHKVTIVPRGGAGGFTRLLPEEDRTLFTKGQFQAMLAVMMGGHVSEEIVFGEVTNGASNDLQKANGVARKMVTEYGMSPGLGPRTFETGPAMFAMGQESDLGYGCSDASAEKIDVEIGNLLHKALETAQEVIESNRAKLSQLAEKLLAEETIEGQELQRMLDESREETPLVA